ncbi:MAG: hypothetical protein HY904_03585 [Deltaproteobacteria bacterium]|nr:hypothetical protein [Deltaproteobacteria bacterium]
MRALVPFLAWLLVAAGWLAVTGEAVAAGCYSVRVQGCGRKARVCVSTSSSAEAERKAVEAFRRAYHCANPNVSSYSASCAEAANDRCDLRF